MNDTDDWKWEQLVTNHVNVQSPRVAPDVIV